MKIKKTKKTPTFRYGIEITKPFSKEMYDHNDAIALEMKRLILSEIHIAYSQAKGDIAADGGMSTGDALVYMQKMNMLSGGLKMVAGFFDDSEKKQMEHEKSLLSMKYAYGKPMTDEQKAFKEANPDWISQHPAMQGQDLYTSPNLMQSQTMASLPTQGTTPSPYIQQQTIGQPTFGRQKAGQYGPRPQKTFTGSKQGLITKGSPQTFDPNRQRSIA